MGWSGVRSRRQIHLGAVPYGTGGPGSHTLWLDPDIPGDASVNIDWFTEVARLAESGLFDLVFIVDSQFITPFSPPHYLNRLEPLTLLSALAVQTARIGLVGTATTSFNSPFNLTRRFGSLDLISRGRPGWNVVTTGDAGTARNYGLDEHYDYDTRCGRAAGAGSAVRPGQFVRRHPVRRARARHRIGRFARHPGRRAHPDRRVPRADRGPGRTPRPGGAPPGRRRRRLRRVVRRVTLVVHRGATWRVRLDRPEAANALSPALVEGLHDVLAEAAEIRPEALVLKGNSRHFAAGFDLAGLSRESDASLAHRFLRIGLLLERLATAPYLTVAVVEGSAIGAGADLVAACDHRLAGPGARFAFPGARFGVVLGTARLRGITDPSVFLGGGTVAAADAAGLVTGTPGDLTAILDATRPALLAAARPVHDADAALAALARSVTRPGLHDRLSAYRRRVRSPRSHSEELA